MHLYMDCFSGLSGDMAMGALIDLGVPVSWIKAQLTPLLQDRFNITCEKVFKSGIHAVDVTVHDHSHAHHGGDHHHHHALDYRKIRDLIQGSSLSAAVQKRSLAVFERIAVAEAKIHGCAIDTVHFHEVGGIDAVVDIVGVILAMEYLKITHVTASPLPLGSGTVTCAHGVLPVPAPATLEILKGIPVYGCDSGCEIITPTGAALAAELSDSFGPMPQRVVTAVGYGAGKRETIGLPNLVRMVLCETPAEADTVVELSCNIDDMTPELLGHAMQTLLKAGALDVWFTPIQMKKNRPASQLSCLCREENRKSLTERILTETTTIGIRWQRLSRTTLTRSPLTLTCPAGDVAAKEVSLPDGSKRITPEYEACKALAEAKGCPLAEIYGQAICAAQELLKKAKPPAAR
ncbi:nickel pincer cofactor biosynthesis protein LarC [Desulfoluna sp.]|uniref:nickel pincer cofactor biosynthesis protein LarC n=1 Tax=Desulfoluna sp. TaxID=2045199 RepID=UPI0026228810|nr:nickel pincer cofactor biosynthesis protein LarC [Desulfoluna sp.]